MPPSPASPMSPAASPSAAARPKPLLRGVSHEVAFVVSLVLGPALVIAARTTGQTVTTVVYAVCLTGMFGVSALFHRRTWSPPARRRMRRLDHSMIFLAIAGTYTALGWSALTGTTRDVVLGVVWCGAVGGIVLKLFWIDAPKWLNAVPYVGLGWVAVGAMPQLARSLGVAGLALLVGGGLAYTVGAVVYARRRPDPVPTVFGYHEVFHAFVIAGALAHYVTIVRVVTLSS